MVKVCYLCKMSESDDVNYGAWESTNNLSVHYFCLLLATHMEQNGADNEGILGFFEKDIRKCMQRCASIECYYCGQPTATITCSAKSCQRYFHLICGRKNNCRFTFIDDYASYCHKHHGIKDANVEKHDYCFICLERMGPYNPVTSMPSCCNRGWMHALCMQKYALFAGYDFKCLLCKLKKDKYVRTIRKRGIYVPDRMALWELEPNAYDSHLLVPDSCEAEPCLCPRGREFSTKKRGSPWFLRKCFYCGSKATHLHCTQRESREFECDDCRPPSEMQSTQQALADAQAQAQSHQRSNDEVVQRHESRLFYVPEVAHDRQGHNMHMEAMVILSPLESRADWMMSSERPFTEHSRQASIHVKAHLNVHNSVGAQRHSSQFWNVPEIEHDPPLRSLQMMPMVVLTPLEMNRK